ncbi:MAG: carbohydrate kinase, partial [Pelolinea sp.]|nr:carbohydrate kinase [Pelolinea sp.]
IIGFRDIHTRAHLYRAMLEGLAFALLEGKERTEKRTGVKIDQLHIVGGGSQSDAAMQLTADVFGMPAARPHTYEASGLGAAIVAAVGAGIHSGYNDALAAMTRLGTTFTPHAATHALYRDLYENVYRKMYKRLQPLYMSMQANEQLNG